VALAAPAARVEPTEDASVPPVLGFGKPVSKPRLPLKTDQIQIPN
jgi:hypothetical protein